VFFHHGAELSREEFSSRGDGGRRLIAIHVSLSFESARNGHKSSGDDYILAFLAPLHIVSEIPRYLWIPIKAWCVKTLK
jgi:hypothetical protein